MYKPCFIKNISGSELTLRSKVLAIDEVYQILDSERIDWSEDDTVLASITTDSSQIGESSTSFISPYSDQINWLKMHTPIEAVIDYTKKYEKMLDATMDNVVAGNTENIDLKIVNQTGEAFVYKHIWGGICFGKNIEIGDYAAFSIVDVDNILGYGAGVTIKKYVQKVYTKPMPMQVVVFSESPASIPVGLYLRCTYTAANVGSTRTICINYDLNNVQES